MNSWAGDKVGIVMVVLLIDPVYMEKYIYGKAYVKAPSLI
ncbi:hypothetical protein ADIMK_2881 [Marinobacterium lacunae]|uniref:Uncharacterized protein n=1 Tax=Marinobacterium lacunae TaxID=1232683 RepID=A0A081FWK6_9GAMM|nr:hypothetical protein ADIMK_2881 [Marinobacterium lacunae]